MPGDAEFLPELSDSEQFENVKRQAAINEHQEFLDDGAKALESSYNIKTCVFWRRKKLK